MKFTEFKSPTGVSGNILSPSNWLQMILGVLVFLVTFGIGQHLFQRATNRVPQASLTPLFPQPAPMSASAPSREVYS